MGTKPIKRLKLVNGRIVEVTADESPVIFPDDDGGDSFPPIPGQKGDTGATGATGSAGSTGATGQQGQAGSPIILDFSEPDDLPPPFGSGSAALTMAQLAPFLPGIGAPYGFHLEYGSSSTLVLSTGKAIDKTGAVVINLASATTITVTTAASAAGNDRTQLAGTGTTAASQTLTGSGTSFLTAFGTRAGTGTFSTSTTAVTGTGTKFLTELAVGDLLGFSGGSYARVSAIASDTSATLTTALPSGNATNQNVSVIENPTVSVGSDPARRINSITNNTTLTAESNFGTNSGANVFAGDISTTATNAFYHVWVGTGGTGTTAFVSTQRTTPYGVSGYNSNFRRVGSFGYTGSAILEFAQLGDDNTREYRYEFAVNTNSSRLLSAGSATAWTDVIGSVVTPPTAKALVITMVEGGPSGTILGYVRKRNVGNSTVSRPTYVEAVAGSVDSAQMVVPCDGAQCIQYANSGAGGATYIDCAGYRETLNA